MFFPEVKQLHPEKLTQNSKNRTNVYLEIIESGKLVLPVKKLFQFDNLNSLEFPLPL